MVTLGEIFTVYTRLAVGVTVIIVTVALTLESFGIVTPVP